MDGAQQNNDFAPYSVGPYPPVQATGGHPYVNYQDSAALAKQLAAVEEIQVGRAGGQLAWPIFAQDLLSRCWKSVQVFPEGWQLRLVLDGDIDPLWLGTHDQATTALREIASQAWALQVPFWPHLPDWRRWYADLAQASARGLIVSIDAIGNIDTIDAKDTIGTDWASENQGQALVERLNQIPHLSAVSVPLSWARCLGQDGLLSQLPAPTLLVRAVAGDNLLRSNLQETYQDLVRLQAAGSFTKKVVVVSEDLRHLPVRSHGQEQIDFPALAWVSFAQEKIRETQVLAAALQEGQGAAIPAFAAASIARASWQAAGIQTSQLRQICHLDPDFNYREFFAKLRQLSDVHVATEQSLA